LEEKDRLLDETLDRRRSQLQRILTVVQEVQSEIEIEREQNPQIIDYEEAATTPDSMRSEFFSPIANLPSPAEHDNDNNGPPQINGINGINSSSSNLADNDNEVDRHRNDDDDENKQQNNEENESSPQQQSQDISISDNPTELGEDEDELDVTEPDDVETINGSSDEAELNQNVEIEDLDDDVVTSDNEKNTIKCDEENEDDIPVPTDDGDDGDDGEIVEDSDENQRGEKRKRSDEEEEEEEEEGLIKEKALRLSDEYEEDEGLIEESEDEGAIIKDDEQ
jgi:hypothetical protein